MINLKYFSIFLFFKFLIFVYLKLFSFLIFICITFFPLVCIIIFCVNFLVMSIQRGEVSQLYVFT